MARTETRNNGGLNMRIPCILAGMPDYNEDSASARAPYMRMKMHDSVQEAGVSRLSGKKRPASGRWNETVFMYTSRRRGAHGKLVVELREPRAKGFSFAEDSLLGSVKIPLDSLTSLDGRQRHSVKLRLKANADTLDADYASITTYAADEGSIDAEESESYTMVGDSVRSGTYTIGRDGGEPEVRDALGAAGAALSGYADDNNAGLDSRVMALGLRNATASGVHTTSAAASTDMAIVTTGTTSISFTATAVQNALVASRKVTPERWYVDPEGLRWSLPQQLPGVDAGTLRARQDVIGTSSLPSGAVQVDATAAAAANIVLLPGMDRIAALSRKEVSTS